MEKNNNEFFGADEKFIPNSPNNYQGYAPKEKKKFNILLVLLLVGIPVIIFMIILVIMISMMGKNMQNNKNISKEILEIGRATSDLHQDISQMQVAKDIYESSSDALDDATKEVEVQAKEMFNMKFTGYEGKGQRASAVKALITMVISSNSDNSTQVELKGITDISEVESKKTYNVDFNYNSVGYINEIVITEAE